MPGAGQNRDAAAFRPASVAGFRAHRVEEFRILRHFLLFSLNGEYKIRECKSRGKYSSCEGSYFNDDWQRFPSLGGATPPQDPRTDRAKRADHRTRTGRAVCRLVGHGARGLGCPVLPGYGGSISRRRRSQVGSESRLGLRLEGNAALRRGGPARESKRDDGFAHRQTEVPRSPRPCRQRFWLPLENWV